MRSLSWCYEGFRVWRLVREWMGMELYLVVRLICENGHWVPQDGERRDVFLDLEQRLYQGFLYFQNILQWHCADVSGTSVWSITKFIDFPYVYFYETRKRSTTLYSVHTHIHIITPKSVNRSGKYGWKFIYATNYRIAFVSTVCTQLKSRGRFLYRSLYIFTKLDVKCANRAEVSWAFSEFCFLCIHFTSAELLIALWRCVRHVRPTDINPHIMSTYIHILCIRNMFQTTFSQKNETARTVTVKLYSRILTAFEIVKKRQNVWTFPNFTRTIHNYIPM
jgi:hypothetical protein